MDSTVTVEGRASAQSYRDYLAPLAAFLLGFALIALVAGTAGGFRPTTWAWTALLTWWLVVLALILVRRRPGFLDLAMVAGALAFAGWFAASALWSQSVPSTLDETIRYIAYAGIVTSALLVVERRTAPHLVGGVLAAISLLGLYALGTRILPDRLGSFDSVAANYRLSVPITYWNGLGVFCVMGLLLALGFAARGERLATRIVAAAPIPLLAATMYFTFSRGAWLALLVGLAAGFVIDPRRLQLTFVTAVLGLVAAAAVVLCSRADGLVTKGATLARATHDGHRVVPFLLGLAMLSAAIAGALAVIERRLPVPGAARVAWIAVLVVLAVAAVGVTWQKAGSPVHVARQVWAEAHAPPRAVTGGSVGNRLFDLSSNGRFELWHTSWDAFRAHPLAGSGGGTFWQLWAASPRQSFATLEGHSVYLETLAELGIVGLAILLCLLLPPLVAAVRARSTPLVPLVLAALVGWLAHAGIDWDWELMGVTGAALLCGVALVTFDRRESRELPDWIRIVGGVAAVVLALASMASVVSLERLATASSALGSGNDTKALRDARSARTFAPWSVDALDLLAEAQANLGLRADVLSTRRRIVARDPNSWSAWLNLAVAASGTERRHAAAEAIRLNARAPRL